MFGAKSAGQATSFAPDYGKAKTAAARVLALLDRRSQIDTYADVGAKPVSTSPLTLNRDGAALNRARVVTLSHCLR